jgi:hypothetical protein
VLGQLAKEGVIYHTEDGSVRPDSERQCGNGYYSKAGILPQSAAGKTNVRCDAVQHTGVYACSQGEVQSAWVARSPARTQLSAHTIKDCSVPSRWASV